jgi:hypothetical protein
MRPTCETAAGESCSTRMTVWSYVSSIDSVAGTSRAREMERSPPSTGHDGPLPALSRFGTESAPLAWKFEPASTRERSIYAVRTWLGSLCT